VHLLPHHAGRRRPPGAAACIQPRAAGGCTRDDSGSHHRAYRHSGVTPRVRVRADRAPAFSRTAQSPPL